MSVAAPTIDLVEHVSPDAAAADEPFQFLDPGPLIDGNLELVSPHEGLIDDLLASARHPLTLRDAPDDAKVSRTELEDYLRSAPAGRVPSDPQRRRCPQYDFWMVRSDDPAARPGRHGLLSRWFALATPPLRVLGGITLRVGRSPPIELYYGHVGYHVFPAARGQHYAERACRLLLPLARRHGLNPLWITCNPDNLASRRTCERLGMRLVETVAVPGEDALYLRGEREKCRYRLDL
jgi:RimJ/RimL family protein N-acetyltransferase